MESKHPWCKTNGIKEWVKGQRGKTKLEISLSNKSWPGYPSDASLLIKSKPFPLKGPCEMRHKRAVLRQIKLYEDVVRGRDLKGLGSSLPWVGEVRPW